MSDPQTSNPQCGLSRWYLGDDGFMHELLPSQAPDSGYVRFIDAKAEIERLTAELANAQRAYHEVLDGYESFKAEHERLRASERAWIDTALAYRAAMYRAGGSLTRPADETGTGNG